MTDIEHKIDPETYAKYELHSIQLNKMMWDLAEALGMIQWGAQFAYLDADQIREAAVAEIKKRKVYRP